MESSVLCLDCQTGITGDMLLGGLLHLGYTLPDLQEILVTPPFQSYQLRFAMIEDRGIWGVRFDVQIQESSPAYLSFSALLAIIHDLKLPYSIEERVIHVFRNLTEVRAEVMKGTFAEATYAETEVMRMLIVCVGVLHALEKLSIASVVVWPLPFTRGYVETSQGLMPVPSPVTLELLRRVHASWVPSALEGELVTPIAAAILAVVARFDKHAFSIRQVGYGFGWRQLSTPHCLRCCLGLSVDPPRSSLFERSGSSSDFISLWNQSELVSVYEPRQNIVEVGYEDMEHDWVAVLESNLDTMTGELLGGVMEKLFSLGALDVHYQPLQMKKNRPGSLLTVLCPPDEGERFAQILLRETNTLGVRLQYIHRIKARREQITIATPFGAMLVKVKRLGGRIISVSPEYEECLRFSKEQNIPLIDIYEIARQAIRDAALS